MLKIAVADVSGGKGYPATPWRKEGPQSVLDLEKAKMMADTYQTLSIFPQTANGGKKDEALHIERLRLAPTPFREGDTAVYELAGTTGSGGTIAISFSQIEGFTVRSKNNKTITLSVTVWPDITPKELLQKQPTYKQLYMDYRRDVILVLNLESADGREQAFNGGWGDITLPLAKLEAGTKAGFYEEHPHMMHPLRFWWAIPSVANDKDYPYRVIPLK
jgi:hypothetical protein